MVTHKFFFNEYMFRTCKVGCFYQIFERFNQDRNDLNQLIKISDLNRDLNQMIFFL